MMIIIVKIIFEFFLEQLTHGNIFTKNSSNQLVWSLAKDFELTILIIASLPWNTKRFCEALVDTPSSKC